MQMKQWESQMLQHAKILDQVGNVRQLLQLVEARQTDMEQAKKGAETTADANIPDNIAMEAPYDNGFSDERSYTEAAGIAKANYKTRERCGTSACILEEAMG